MFWKLCKFEWKCSYRSYLFLYALLLVSSLCINFGSVIQSANSIAGLAVGFVTLVYGVCLCALFIMAFVNVIRNYHQSMFKRNAYLTHTLPVPSWMLVVSKLLAGIFWLVLSFFVCFLSVLLIALNLTRYDLFELLRMSGELIMNIPFFNILKIVTYTIVSVGEMVALFYFVMSAANTKYIQRHRAAAAVIIFFVISFVQGMVNDFIMQGIFSLPMQFHMNGSSLSFWFPLFMSLIMMGVWVYANVYLLDHKMEIE